MVKAIVPWIDSMGKLPLEWHRVAIGEKRIRDWRDRFFQGILGAYGHNFLKGVCSSLGNFRIEKEFDVNYEIEI